MAGEAALGKSIEIFGAPSKLVNQRPERKRGVHAASGDHHVRPGRKRSSDRPSAKVGVEAQWLGNERGPVTHFREAESAEFVEAVHQVIALDPSDAQRDARSIGHGAQRFGRSPRIHPARVRHHAHPLLDETRQVATDHRDHVGRITKSRIPLARSRENSHGDLGQRLEENVVAPPGIEQLRRSKRRVPPSAGRAAKHDDAFVTSSLPILAALAHQVLSCLAQPIRQGLW